MRYLLFINAKEDVSVFKQFFDSEDHIAFVLPGESFIPGPADNYFIRKDQYSDYQELLHTLPALPDRIIYAWSWTPLQEIEQNTTSNLTSDAEACFLLAKAILQKKLTHKIVCTYVNMDSNPTICPAHGAFIALAKSLAQESMKLIYKQVIFADCHIDSISEVVPILLTETNKYVNDKLVRYFNGRRQVQVFKEKVVHKNRSDTQSIKENGVYLISGGASGLGFIVARNLARLRTVTLILLGRSEKNNKIKQIVDELNSLGAHSVYYSADVTDLSRVQEIVTNVNKKYGKINGIYHAAGIIRDSRVVDKSLKDFRAVLAPKIYGTLSLDWATQEQPLDFIIYFSSISSVLGNIGQTDYSYANAFMDQYAAYRNQLQKRGVRQGCSLSINWPLWENGGMKADEQVKQYTTNKLGLPPLETKHGLELLENTMSQGESQLLALHGDRKKVCEVFMLGDNVDKTPGKQTRSSNTNDLQRNRINTVTKEDILRLLQDEMIAGVIDILEVNPKDADIDTDMNRFGFDSMTITTFSSRIEQELNIELTPVVFFEYQTVRELSEYMYDEHESQLKNWYNKRHSYQSENNSISKKVYVDDGIELSNNFGNNEPNYPNTPLIIDAIKYRPSSNISSGAGYIDTASARSSEAIAIIGIDGIFPQSENVDVFWRNIEDGKNMITEVPPERWSWQSYWGDPFQNKNKTKVKWGGFIEGIKYFDAEFFGISRREAEVMDPQHRLFLQTVWRSIENAGYRVSSLTDKEKIGIFCGSASIDYHDLIANREIDIDVFAITGGMFSVLVNRISYLLNFRGPSEAIETACSSSMVAIHRAIQSIRLGECDIAIAGGVHLMMTPSVHIGLDKGGFLSQQGRCATFDESADGYTRGEGCASLLLKPLNRAESDGDFIHAVIRGSAVNHGGMVNTLTTPNPNAQTEVIVNAWSQAGVDPRTITCIEAHGTGTALGDPIEVKALKVAFEKLYQNNNLQKSTEKHCALGSVKSNIGHLEFVAGISGVVKMIKAMQHEILPKTIHFNKLNPYIQLDKTPFYILTENQKWERSLNEDGELIPFRAGVSSFGFGGVNSHVALEEYRNILKPGDYSQQVILLSAKTQEALANMIKNLESMLKRKNEYCLGDIAFTLASGREMYSERVLILADSIAGLISVLPTCLTSPCSDVLYRSDEKSTRVDLKFLKNRQEVMSYKKQLLDEKQFNKMASHWVSGLDINWEFTDYVSGKRRIPLPSYPFAKTAYWVSSSDSMIKMKEYNMLNSDIMSLLNDGFIDDIQAEQLLVEINGSGSGINNENYAQ
ncbi:MAG: SDR family NAD(P)-dependent oxidoreductase [Exilibacterium sp.]